MTHTADRNELKRGVLPRAITEFVKQHPTVEFKRHVDSDLHDRFILTSSELILLGHGLKDVGNKDSFIVRLSRDFVPDTIDEVKDSFDLKWADAQDLP